MSMLEMIPACCDHAGGLIPVETARERAIEGLLPVSGEEVVPLQQARGRVGVASVSTAHAIPPFDQSAMDGYAVRSSSIAAVPAILSVVARQAAGPDQKLAISAGPAAVRIFTGAPLPSGFDAVVMQEHCERRQDAVTINERPRAGQHVRRAGDDVKVGQIVVDRDTLLDARHIAILAAGGVAQVRVRRRLRVGVLSTGNELRQPDEELAPGQIHDSNRSMLMALLSANAMELTDLGCIEDDRAAVARRIADASTRCDVLISTGGVSVGEEDHIGAAVRSAGGSFAPLKASIKPGKPISIGRIGPAVVIALPGNPVAALVTYLWFGRPMLQALMGLRPGHPRSVGAITGFDESRHPGRDEFVPAVIVGRDELGRPVVEKNGVPGTARLLSLIGADGLLRIPGHLSAIRRREPLDLYLFGADFSI